MNDPYADDESDRPIYTEREYAEVQNELEKLLAEREIWRPIKELLEQGYKEHYEKLEREARERTGGSDKKPEAEAA